jgi:glycosyltransferase involved in cell wall biosynthesis
MTAPWDRTDLGASFAARRFAGRVRRRARDWWRGETIDTFFDVYNPDELNPLLIEHGVPPLSGDPAQAEAGIEGAIRFVLHTLIHPPTRRRWPHPLTSGRGGLFFNWLVGAEARKRGLSAAGSANVDAAFAARPGKVARRVWELRADLRDAFPLGLTPTQRRLYAAWLLRQGAGDFGLRPEQVLWFLFELAEDPAHGLTDSYLWQPSWQQAVPHGLTRSGWHDLKRWLAAKYAIRGRWLQTAECPERTGPGDVTRPGVNMLAHYRFPSGLQEEALQLTASLKAAGFGIARRDVPVGYPCDCDDPTDYSDPELYDVTFLKTGAGRGFDAQLAAAGLHPRPGVYRIAGWSWELEWFPPEYAEQAKLVDEIWTPSDFCSRAVQTVITDRPVRTMRPGVAPPRPADLPREHFGLAPGRFLVLFLFDMGSAMERKNPFGLIRAFRRAFAANEPADLAIKLSRGDARPAEFAALRAAADRDGVTLINRVMSRAESFALMAMCDCYASLHRAEGFGLTVAEAMLLGKPVVATNYSATTEFLTPEVGLPVDFTMSPIGAGHPPYPHDAVWAEPDEEHAAARLRWVFEHPEEARALGARARRHAETVLSVEAVGRRMADRLREIHESRRRAAA